MTRIAEAYRNKVVYEYFKDCPDKPKFSLDHKTEYFLATTTGGPIKETKRYKPLTQDQIARAALKIQRAIRRWKRKRDEEKRLRDLEYRKHQEAQQDPRAFFVTQSSKTTLGAGDNTGTHSSHKDSRHYSLADESMKHPALENPSLFQSALTNNERVLEGQGIKTSLHKNKASHGSMVTFNLSQVS